MKAKQLLALALVALGVSSANAQGIVSGNSYYIQNVESGLFLCGANDWGTRGAVSTQGDMFKVELNNGAYTITNNEVTVANKTLGYNIYVDSNTGQNGNTWTIAPVDGKEGVYTIYGKGKANNIADSFDGYLSQATTTGLHIGYNAGSVNPADASAEWRFLTREEAIAQLSAATATNGISASFLIENANFSRNHSQAKWTVSANCTNKNLGGGDNGNMCAESYRSAFTISQKITGIPNGVYGVTAQGFYRHDLEGEDKAEFFANDVTTPFPLTTGKENSMTDASNAFKTGAYTIEEMKVTVIDGTLEIGVKNPNSNLWCIWDNFNITYYGGIDLSELKEALAARIVVAQGLTGDMNSGIAKALADAITDGQNCAETEQAINDAISEINTAIDNANASIAQYADVAAKIAILDAAGKAAFNASAAGAKYADKTLAATDDITADYIAAVKAQTTPGSDFTAVIVNPEVNGETGWTTSRTDGNGPLLSGIKFEYWSYTQGKGNFDYYQVITGLPNGKYTVTADMMNDQASSADAFVPAAGVYAQNGAVKAWALVDTYANGAGEGAIKAYTTDEIAVTDGTLRIGVSTPFPTNMPARWFVADNFKLTFVEGISLDDYYASIGVLLEEADGITGKQQKACVDALDDAVEAAKGYSSITDIDKLQEIIDGLSTAIESSKASINAYAELKNALDSYPDRSDVFGLEFNYHTEAYAMYDAAIASASEIKNQADGMMNAYRAYVKDIAADGYATVEGVAAARESTSWVYTTNPQNNGVFNNPGNNDINGNTMWENWRGAGLAEGDMKQTVTGLPNGKYFLRMVSFTRNSPNENDYIYIKSGDAMAQAISFGDAANSNGFVNITDPIEVTNGEVEIGLHVGSGCDWAAIGGVVLYKFADGASMAVNAEAQYGTFCAPFDVEVPAGVTASTATLKGNLVELTEVEDGIIPANTPVILEAVAGLEETIVYGKAVEGTPVAGVLTGVYEETAVPVGSYVLQMQDEVGFYKVPATFSITVSANRCYLTAPASSAKAFYFASDDATAIKAIDALTSGNAGIYTTDGVKVNSLQKGINIIKTADGKTQKVLVK